MIRKEGENPAKFKSLTVNKDTYGELDVLRKREQESLGLTDLSWNNFLSRLVKKLKDSRK